VRRNSANFASRARCKSFAGHRLVSGGEAKLSEFRLGGCAKFSPGEALFVRHQRISCPKLPPHTFVHLMPLWHIERSGTTGFAGATPIIRECEAIGSSHQLVLELNMLERRTAATIRKALASKSTGGAGGTLARWNPAWWQCSKLVYGCQYSNSATLTSHSLRS
jgi:hypothetical protein